MAYKPPIWIPGQTQNWNPPAIRVSGFENHPVEARLLADAFRPQISHFISKNRQSFNLGSTNFQGGRMNLHGVNMRYTNSFGQETILLEFKPEVIKKILEEAISTPGRMLYTRLRVDGITRQDRVQSFSFPGHHRMAFKAFTHEGMVQYYGLSALAETWSAPWAYPLAQVGSGYPWLYIDMLINGTVIPSYMLARSVSAQYLSAGIQNYQLEAWWNLSNIWKDFGYFPFELGFGSSPSFAPDTSGGLGIPKDITFHAELHNTPIPSSYRIGYETGDEFELEELGHGGRDNWVEDARDFWCWTAFDDRYTVTDSLGFTDVTGFYGSEINVPPTPLLTLDFSFRETYYTSGSVLPSVWYKLQTSPNGTMLLL